MTGSRSLQINSAISVPMKIPRSSSSYSHCRSLSQFFLTKGRVHMQQNVQQQNRPAKNKSTSHIQLKVPWLIK